MDANTVAGYLEFSKPCPYPLTVRLMYASSPVRITLEFNPGDTYMDFTREVIFEPGLELLESCEVADFDPYDTNYRIIPTHIYTGGYSVVHMGELGIYLHASNINYLPISEDDTGPNGEVCPIIDLNDLQNTDQNVIWYNYNGEILFRDLYTGLIYALNSYGDLYQWN
jgi:hypothetical protein